LFFAGILNEARIRELSAKSAQALHQHGTFPNAARNFGNDDEDEKVIPTLLECKSRHVDKANERDMAFGAQCQFRKK